MNVDAINRAVQSLAISDVYVRETVARIEPELEPTVGGIKLSARFKAGTTGHRILNVGDESKLRAMVAYDIKAEVELFFDEPNVALEEQGRTPTVIDGKTLAARISVVFCAMYRVKGSAPDNEALQEFGVNNALFHVWPYWREYLGSICNRLHIKPILLPMFRPPPMRQAESQNKREGESLAAP